MSDELDLTNIPRVKPEKGKAQWVPVDFVATENDTPNHTVKHKVHVPLLMPCTTIFVHGVNSQGEWYKSAAEQFCLGLNKRLGRTDLTSGGKNGHDEKTMRVSPNVSLRASVISLYLINS